MDWLDAVKDKDMVQANCDRLRCLVRKIYYIDRTRSRPLSFVPCIRVVNNTAVFSVPANASPRAAEALVDHRFWPLNQELINKKWKETLSRILASASQLANLLVMKPYDQANVRMISFDYMISLICHRETESPAENASIK